VFDRSGDRRALPERTAVKTLSIVTPCFNEEAGIADCYEAVRRVMADRLPGYAYEHIFIDNASSDRTVLILRGIAAGDARVKVIVNARNRPFAFAVPRDAAGSGRRRHTGAR
jgi:glycosyltransferase involved in cell wall biosynthesis